jgi:circadian clock protein KaiB
MAQAIHTPQVVLNDTDDASVCLRLYVAGQSSKSLRAVENLRHIIEKHMPGACLEVIDIYQQREKAKEANIIAAPMLEKYSPEPIKKIIGDLSDEDRVVLGLEIGSA